MWRLTDDQRALREEIRAVVREEIQPRVREIDEGCEYPRDLYGVMAEHNLLGLSVLWVPGTLFAWSVQPARNVDRPSGAPAARWQAPVALGGCALRGQRLGLVRGRGLLAVARAVDSSA